MNTWLKEVGRGCLDSGTSPSRRLARPTWTSIRPAARASRPRRRRNSAHADRSGPAAARRGPGRHPRKIIKSPARARPHLLDTPPLFTPGNERDAGTSNVDHYPAYRVESGNIVPALVEQLAAANDDPPQTRRCPRVRSVDFTADHRHCWTASRRDRVRVPDGVGQPNGTGQTGRAAGPARRTRPYGPGQARAAERAGSPPGAPPLLRHGGSARSEANAATKPPPAVRSVIVGRRAVSPRRGGSGEGHDGRQSRLQPDRETLVEFDLHGAVRSGTKSSRARRAP